MCTANSIVFQQNLGDCPLGPLLLIDVIAKALHVLLLACAVWFIPHYISLWLTGVSEIGPGECTSHIFCKGNQE